MLTVGLVDRQRGAAIGGGTGCDPDKVNRVANNDLGYRCRECGGRVELEDGGIPIKQYQRGGSNIAQFEGGASIDSETALISCKRALDLQGAAIRGEPDVAAYRAADRAVAVKVTGIIG